LAEYTNPNQQGGGMDSSKLLVYVLVFLAFFLGMKYFMPTAGQQQPPPTQQTAPQATAPAPVVQAAAPVAPAAAAITAAPSQTVIDTPVYRVTFTNRGAQVTSWILKQQKDTSGKPLDLVQPAAAQFGYPLALHTTDAPTNIELATALFVPSATGTLTAPATLSFDYSDGNGLVAHKSFRFDDTYVLHAESVVTEQGRAISAALAWPAGFGDQELAGQFLVGEIDLLSSGKEEHQAPKKVKDGDTMAAPLEFAGVSDQHFAAIFLPDAPDTAQLSTYTHDLKLNPADKNAVPVLGAGLAAADGHVSTRIFVGPKVYALLKSVHTTGSGATLERIIDFGWLGPVAKGLFLALFFTFEHITHNWGWAIVVLTLTINVVLLPVRISTMKSAVKMQRIQPQMEAIKAKYAKLKMTDPRRGDMNAEIMQLQKDNGVNMFGGCLPNLMTLPLLIAFFSMLPKVTEMRMMHWYWLPDLTAKDPLHILPLFVIVTMFVVQYSMPSPGIDPQQQKMMAFMMPAFSGFIVWNYASGLGLYWATGNIVMILQQIFLNRTAMGREMREIAAKRARRKAGAGVVQGKFNKH
jgi:YidC/Oxa1 family membrane protein insertase